MDKILSVIIPVHNTEKYLERCLDSVISALPRNSEIMVINDGSTDRSQEIINKYIATRGDIIHSVVYDTCRGAAFARNAGLSLATGKYIMFIDSDDWIDKDTYSSMMGLVSENSFDITVFDMYLDLNAGDMKYEKCFNSDANDKLLGILDVPLVASPCNKIFCRRLVENIRFPEGIMNEDITFVLKALAMAGNIGYIDKPFYHYCLRDGSVQGSDFDSRRFDIFTASKILFESICEYKPDIQEKIKYSVYRYQLLGLLFYPIRKLNSAERYRNVIIFIDNIRWYIKDILCNNYVKAFLNQGNMAERSFKKTCIFLMKHRLKKLLCLYLFFADFMLEKVRFRKASGR